MQQARGLLIRSTTFQFLPDLDMASVALAWSWLAVKPCLMTFTATGMEYVFLLLQFDIGKRIVVAGNAL